MENLIIFGYRIPAWIYAPVIYFLWVSVFLLVKKLYYGKLQKFAEKGGDVTAQWNYDPEDLDLEEDIEDLKIISKLDLKLNPIGGEARFKKLSEDR